MINTKKKFYYNSYGVNIESEIEITEFIPIDNDEFTKADISIYQMKIPEEIQEDLDKGIDKVYQENEIWFHIRNVATYHIKNGDTILVYPEDGHDFNSLKAFLIWRSIGLALLQRNIPIIHGGAVVIDDKAVVFTGKSGSGKSTLTSAFRDMDYGFLTDELCVTSLDYEGNIVIMPGYPQQRLSRAAIDNLGYDYRDFVRNKNKTEMYAIPADSTFINNPKRLAVIVQIEETDDIDEVTIEEFTGIKGYMGIIDNMYMYSTTKYIGLNKDYYEKTVKMGKNVRFFKLKRPYGLFTVDEQVKLVLDAVHN